MIYIHKLCTRWCKKFPECAIRDQFSRTAREIIEEANDIMPTASQRGRARSLVLHDIPAVVGGDPPDPIL